MDVVTVTCVLCQRGGWMSDPPKGVIPAPEDGWITKHDLWFCPSCKRRLHLGEPCVLCGQAAEDQEGETCPGYHRPHTWKLSGSLLELVWEGVIGLERAIQLGRLVSWQPLIAKPRNGYEWVFLDFVLDPSLHYRGRKLTENETALTPQISRMFWGKPYLTLLIKSRQSGEFHTAEPEELEGLDREAWDVIGPRTHLGIPLRIPDTPDQ